MVLLISIYENKMFFEDLGISRIGAFLREKGVPVEVKYIKCDAEIDENLLQLCGQYQYIGFSVYDNNIDYADVLAAKIKEANPQAVIFYGSQYVSIAYESLLASNISADFLVLGDGEYPVYDFITHYDRHNMDELISQSKHLLSAKSHTDKEQCAIDINELPAPLHNSDYLKQSLHVDLNTSSGCVGNCSFCGSIRRKWSGRAPEVIYAEIKRIKEEYNLRSFLFADSSFEDPGKLGKERIGKLVEYLAADTDKYSFSANIRAESFTECPADLELLKRMRQVGFTQLFIGIEAGNSEDLKLYNKKASLAENEAVIPLLKSCDIAPFWGFIMFNPYSTQERLAQNYDFLVKNETPITYHYMSYITLYNNTDIYNLAKADGLVTVDGRNRIEYRFREANMAELFAFIKTNFLDRPIIQQIRNTRDILHFYHYMKPLVNTEKEDGLVLAVSKQLAMLNENYFAILYKDLDLVRAEEQLPGFIEGVMQYAGVLEKVKNSIMKGYYKTYGI